MGSRDEFESPLVSSLSEGKQEGPALATRRDFSLERMQLPHLFSMDFCSTNVKQARSNRIICVGPDTDSTLRLC